MPPKKSAKAELKKIAGEVWREAKKKAKPKRTKRVAKHMTDRVAMVRTYAADVNKQCAFQILNADAAVLGDTFVDAPVSDGSPVHLFSTTTEISLGSVNRTDAAAAYILMWAKPNPQEHIRYATGFDNNGLPTGTGTANVEGYASLATIYDDMRCCAMMLIAKDTGVEEKRNGTCRVFNYNPSAAAMLNDAAINAAPGFEYPPDKLHYPRMPWIPARPEVDHAFVGPTSTGSGESTAVGIKGTFQPIATGQTFMRATVYAIWAGRLNPDMDHVAVPRFYAIDQREVEMHLQAMLLPPNNLYAKGRIMTGDDGPIQQMLADGKVGFEGAKKLFGSGSSLSERLAGGMDLVSSIGSIGSTIAGWFSAEDQAVLRLAGLDQTQLDFICTLLTTQPQGQTGRMTPDRVQTLVERYRLRRHLTHPSRARGRGTSVLMTGRNSFTSTELLRLRASRALGRQPQNVFDPWLDRDRHVATALPWEDLESDDGDDGSWASVSGRAMVRTDADAPPPTPQDVQLQVRQTNLSARGLPRV